MSKAKILYLQAHQLMVAEGFNVRHDLGDLAALTQSITQNGIKMPLHGYKSGDKTEDGLPIYVITDGHRRFAAYSAAKNLSEDFVELPFIQEPKDYTEVDRTYDLIVANDSHPLTMLEEAEVYRRLLEDYKVTQAAIAKRVGKSKMHISNCILLLSAPEKLINQVRDGKVAASTVIEMLKEGKDKEQVAEHVEKAVEAKGGKKVTKKDIVADAGGNEKKLPATDFHKHEQDEHNRAAKKSNQAAPVAASKVESGVDADAVRKDAEEKLIKKLDTLLDTLEKQDAPKKKAAFDALKGVSKWLKGKSKAEDLAKFFFDEE